MAMEEIRAILGWCSVINIGMLVFYFAVICGAHDFVYRIHCRWFHLTEKKFDEIHYMMMGLFKCIVCLFSVVPYLALRIVGG